MRSLFVLITALCIGLGYQLEWIRRRRALLHEQIQKNEFLYSITNVYRRADDGTEDSPDWYYYSNKPAPYLLWLFGERALPDLNLMLPASGAIPNRQHLTDSRYIPYFVSRKHPVYRRATKLFPESRLHVYVMDSNGTGHPAQAIDDNDYRIEAENMRLHSESMKMIKGE